MDMSKSKSWRRLGFPQVARAIGREEWLEDEDLIIIMEEDLTLQNL